MKLPERVILGIAQHHERLDGKGYPVGLRDDRIGQIGRIVAIANRYMNLIDPRRREQALTPYQALQQMYAAERVHYDPSLLTRFVRILGVYPPGTIVELNDERLAIVENEGRNAPKGAHGLDGGGIGHGRKRRVLEGHAIEIHGHGHTPDEGGVVSTDELHRWIMP